jgi:sugar-specific transcriptional regulator TrmB
MTDELIIKAFGSIGIPKMQTVVYMDLLKNKESTAAQVAKRTTMHRTNVYGSSENYEASNVSYKKGR